MKREIEIAGLPERAPAGRFYVLATTPMIQKDTKFVHSILRRPIRDYEDTPNSPHIYVSVNFSPLASMARLFDRLSIARAFCEFLNRTKHLTEDFCVISVPRRKSSSGFLR